MSASMTNERRAVFRVTRVAFRWSVDAATSSGVDAVAIVFIDLLFVGEAGVGVAF